MELKVVCPCGQKYKFDVEPADGRMPFTVNCPVCNRDGTEAANALLAGQFASAPARAATPVAAPAGGTLRISAPSAPAATGAPPVLPAETRPALTGRAAAPSPSLAGAKPAGEFNLGLGILGAVLGAVLGCGLMYGFYRFAEFRFPLMGTGIGVLTGLGARILYKGTGQTLGFISGGIALVATAGTLYLMYGEVAATFIISMIVSVVFAYKIAG